MKEELNFFVTGSRNGWGKLAPGETAAAVDPTPKAPEEGPAGKRECEYDLCLCKFANAKVSGPLPGGIWSGAYKPYPVSNPPDLSPREALCDVRREMEREIQAILKRFSDDTGLTVKRLTIDPERDVGGELLNYIVSASASL